MIEPVHADLVACRRELGRKARCLRHHAAEHEERGAHAALGEHASELRRGRGVGTVVKSQRNVARIAVAGQPPEGQPAHRAEAGDARTRLRDRQSGKASEPGSGHRKPGAPVARSLSGRRQLRAPGRRPSA